MPECIHETELATCGICIPPTAPGQPGLPETVRPQDGWGRWLDARYHGSCAGCDGLIKPGDQIRSDGAGGWLCGSCGEAYGGIRVIRVTGERL